MPSSELKIDWATHEAAKFAVMNWHYSKSMPVGPMIRVGVWEDGKFIGVILFGRGASPALGRAYGCTQDQCCELTRVALRQHKTPVSRIMAIAVRHMHKQSPGLQLIVSFADTDQGHHGGIYQAAGWIYAGLTAESPRWFYKGEWVHNRVVTGGGWQGKPVPNYQSLPHRISPGKHRYLLPLDKAMRERVEKLRQPYPKRVGSADSGTAIPVARDGATPIPTLSPKVQL